MGMEIAEIDEKRLKELIDEAVQKHMRITIEDIEGVRRSPAGVLVRLENRVEYIEKRIENIEKNMATRADAATMATRSDIAALKLELKEETWKLKLYIIILAVLILVTNPKVLELFGKLLGLMK
ncbi:MAG: hypothetical protein ONB44_12505 [candidate division KSB1 bacterium]|nr:hypothetical protein [candidate division KSB1 bacterium]MDZ7312219.1 hypothetical protein [candidate division KSB1 bacterium]